MKRVTGIIAGACVGICPIISQADDAARIRYTPEEGQSAPVGGQLGTAGIPGTQFRVLSGSFYFAFGDSFDESQLKKR